MMSSKQRSRLRGSMDEMLGDLLGDDAEDVPVKSRSPTAGSDRAAGVFRTQSGRRNLLDDDFFSKLAEEAEKDQETSDVSEADPKALLESMKDMDDMDAELFGLKKKPSSSPAPSRTSRTETSKSEDRNKINTAAAAVAAASGVEKTKPGAAPTGSARNYRKFNFMDGVDDVDDGVQSPAAEQDDVDNPLEDLLNDLDEERGKSAPAGKAGKQPGSSPAGQKKEEPAAPAPAPKKRNELNFDEDEDDLMDAMGFSDAPKERGRGLVSKKESEAPQRPRTRLDEILGIGTSPHLLERPVSEKTKKDTTPAERQLQKSSASKDSVIRDEDVTFGSYQPTLVSTPEGRNSRRHSVRFSTEDISISSPERKPKPSTVTSTVTSTRPGRLTSDWLGLKQDEDEAEKTEDEPLRERNESTESSERLKLPPSPSHAGDKGSRVTTKPSEVLRDMPETSTTASAKPEPNGKEDEDDWLAGALSKKKALVEDRLKRQEESLGLGEDIARDTFLGNRNTTLTPHGVKEDTPLHSRQHSHESLMTSSRQENPAPAATTTTHAPEQNPTAVSAAPAQQVSLSTDGLHGVCVQLAQTQRWGVGTPRDLHSLHKQRTDTEHHTGDTTALQTRLIQLEGQVRNLQLENDQLQMLLENVQQRHKHDTELMENTHRTRVKLLEESALQREARAHMELQELTARLETVKKQAQQERAELQEQQQRRLAQSQQERDREVERLRELQRKSILEMKQDYEEQVQRLRRLKDEEIDAVTSATSQTRSLTAVIEQMEQFCLRLGDLSSRVETTHENTTQGLEIGARQRDGQLRVLQERLTQQQRDMLEERTRLKEVIAKMDTQLSEQQRQLQQERWRVTAEQAKAESALRGLEEERRTMMQQLTIEREELERAKSALLDEQQSVMQRCAEERRKLAADWTHFHTQDKLRKDRETDREGHIISIAQEQAELKLRAAELKHREEILQKEKETLEKLNIDLKAEKEKLNTTALQLEHRIQEVESLSKLACERYGEGEQALQEARQVEAGHQTRLRSIRTEIERMRTQEQHLQQERMRMTDHHREMDRMKHRIPTNHKAASANQLITEFSPVFNSTAVPPPANINQVSPQLQATLSVLRHTAEKDRDFLQDEQFFLSALKHTSATATLRSRAPRFPGSEPVGMEADAELRAEFTDAASGRLRLSVTLTHSCLTVRRTGGGGGGSPVWQHGQEHELALGLADCVGCRACRSEDEADTAAYLSVYLYPARRSWTRAPAGRQRVEHRFRVANEEDARVNLEEAETWARAVRHRASQLVQGFRNGVELGRVCVSRSVMVLVNPQSGRGQAMSLYTGPVLSMLTEANISHTLFTTERQNHARELVRNADLSQWSAIVILSGDGLLFEVINGLMEREDWDEAIRTPLGILPGGSGNALAASVHHYTQAGPALGEDLLLSCCFLLCKGLVCPLDMVSVRLSSGPRLFSFLSLAWGFVADVDIESEKFRHVGAMRFLVGTLLRLASLRTYQGRLAFLPAGENSNSSSLHPRTSLCSSVRRVTHMQRETSNRHERAGQNTHQNSNDEDFLLRNDPKDTRLPDDLLSPIEDPVPTNWTVEKEQEFVLVLVTCHSHLAEEMVVSPDARPDDGHLHLIYVTAGISRPALLRLFLAMEKGTHLSCDCPHLIYRRVQALRLEPITKPGVITVDGEQVEYGPIQAQVHQGYARIICG